MPHYYVLREASSRAHAPFHSSLGTPWISLYLSPNPKYLNLNIVCRYNWLWLLWCFLLALGESGDFLCFCIGPEQLYWYWHEYISLTPEFVLPLQTITVNYTNAFHPLILIVVRRDYDYPTIGLIGPRFKEGRHEEWVEEVGCRFTFGEVLSEDSHWWLHHSAIVGVSKLKDLILIASRRTLPSLQA